MRCSFFTRGGLRSVPRGAASSSSSSASPPRPSGPPCYQVLVTPVVRTAASGHEVGAPVSSPPAPRASGSFSTSATTQPCSFLSQLGREGGALWGHPSTESALDPHQSQRESNLWGLPSRLAIFPSVGCRQRSVTLPGLSHLSPRQVSTLGVDRVRGEPPFQICLETQKTPKSQNNLEKEEQSWRHHTPWLHTGLFLHTVF